MIAIIGMHRSGTSAVAGALHKLGADLGPSSSWLPAAADNPRGFFEYLPVVDLNRQVLAALGGTWSSPPALPMGWIDDERIATLRVDAEELSATMPNRMIVKDPRLSLLVPLWEVVGEVPSSVLCLRHPIAVAESLVIRNGFKIDEGLALWFRYNAAAHLNRPEALVLEYEELLADPVPELHRVAEHLGMEVSGKVLSAAADTVYRSMAHHEGVQVPSSPIGIACERLYDRLRSRQPLDQDEAVDLWARLITALPWAGPADHDISRIRHEVTDLTREIDRLTEENQRLRSRYERLEMELRRAWLTMDIAAISETAEVLHSHEDGLK